jgi:hypothetical protein
MRRRAAILGTTLLLVLVATWAASVGPSGVLRGDGPDRGGAQLSQQPQDEEVGGHAREDPTDLDHRGSGVLRDVLLAGLQLAGAAVVLWVLVMVARRTPRVRRRRGQDREQPGHDEDFETLDAQRLEDAVLHDATAQRALLQEGSPRNAIVACWHRFEVQASSIGLAREPWETSSEFTLRLLELVDADPAAVRELAGLYREARFSDHEVAESSRRTALAALDVVHADLRRRASAVVPGGAR